MEKVIKKEKLIQNGKILEEKHYNSQGKVVYYRDRKGYEIWNKYDENGNKLYCSDSTGYWEEMEYNKDGKITHVKTSEGKGMIYQYDDKGRVTYEKDEHGQEKWKKYDENGNILYFRNHRGYEEWRNYDSNGNVIHHIDTDGYEMKAEYNEQGLLVHYTDNMGVEWWKEYNDEGLLIHYKGNDEEYTKEYEYYEDESKLSEEDDYIMNEITKFFECPLCNNGELEYYNRKTKTATCNCCSKSFKFSAVYEDSETKNIGIRVKCYNPNDKIIEEVYKLPCKCDFNISGNWNCNGKLLYNKIETPVEKSIVTKESYINCETCGKAYSRVDVNYDNLTYTLYRK